MELTSFETRDHFKQSSIPSLSRVGKWRSNRETIADLMGSLSLLGPNVVDEKLQLQVQIKLSPLENAPRSEIPTLAPKNTTSVAATSAPHESANRSRGLIAVGIALLAALFFTFTYILNRAIANEGGHWAWTASLRYFFSLLLMLPIMRWQGGLAPVGKSIAARPLAWLQCSVVGFVLFYMLLAYASDSGPSWLVAGSFQFTAVAGMLCAPLIYRDERRKIPLAGLSIAGVILLGVLFMQIGSAGGTMNSKVWIALVCVLGAATAYPLGNRILLLRLEEANEKLGATQRVFGMTLMSQPFWILVALYAWSQAGFPTWNQLLFSAGVALTAGVIATILFFQATGMVQDNPIALGASEAMQASELLFAIGLGAIFLSEPLPRGIAIPGAFLVLLGIIAFALLVARASRKAG